MSPVYAIGGRSLVWAQASAVRKSPVIVVQ